MNATMRIVGYIRSASEWIDDTRNLRRNAGTGECECLRSLTGANNVNPGKYIVRVHLAYCDYVVFILDADAMPVQAFNQRSLHLLVVRYFRVIELVAEFVLSNIVASTWVE